MKFYSEVLEKFFDSEAECKKAEEEQLKLEKEQKEKEKIEAAAISKEKKNLANAIEEADLILKLIDACEGFPEKDKEIFENILTNTSNIKLIYRMSEDGRNNNKMIEDIEYWYNHIIIIKTKDNNYIYFFNSRFIHWSSYWNSNRI